MKLLGASWKTDLMGYGLMAFGVIQQVLTEHPLPQTTHEWVVLVGYFIVGFGFKLSKDGDKSNAPVPVEEAQKVPKPDPRMGG